MAWDDLGIFTGNFFFWRYDKMETISLSVSAKAKALIDRAGNATKLLADLVSQVVEAATDSKITINEVLGLISKLISLVTALAKK